MEETRVVLVGSHREVVGPTSCEAPFLANELAGRLLDELPDDVVEPTIRCSFVVGELLMFSWELDAALMHRLAGANAALEFCVNHDRPLVGDLQPNDFDLAIELNTGELDPDELTARLGVAPTDIHRRGEPAAQNGTRKKRFNLWRYEHTVPPADDLSSLVQLVCDGVPAEIGSAVADCNPRLSLRVVVGAHSGGFAFDRAAVRRIAALRMPFACFLFNYFA
jgi:hypothetical protein